MRMGMASPTPIEKNMSSVSASAGFDPLVQRATAALKCLNNTV